MRDSILSVEDDALQSEWIRQTIATRFPDARLNQISTEYEFESKFEEIASKPPKLILLDVMLRWTDPAPNMPPRPEEVKQGGIGQAGIRCERRLKADPRTKNIPVILYTVLQTGSLQLPAHVTHLQKNADPSELLRRISETLQRPSPR